MPPILPVCTANINFRIEFEAGHNIYTYIYIHIYVYIISKSYDIAQVTKAENIER